MARGRMLKLLGAAAAAVAVAVVATGAAAQDAANAVIEDSDRSRPLPIFSRRRGRIVGGREVTELDRDSGSQFMATLYTPGGGFYCGASLISFDHVLTRAGCYAQVGDEVRVGRARLFQGVLLKVTKVTSHPDFDPNGDLNDIAVLRVSGPSEDAMVRAGAVPAILKRNPWKPHGFYITGFGAVDKKARTAGSLQLKRGYQPLVAWSKCKELLKFVKLADGRTLPLKTEAQLCTNYQSNGSGALCERDVGGPMYRVGYFPTSNGQRVKKYVIYGVSSYWVGTTTERCPQGFPNVGTSVTFYYNWIRSAMNN